ncbi:hypothetical protein G3N59_14335 [Paraburkholderia sp. Ac-20340]|uniref:HNH endonuclease n=1 Tax=Paraburkholderia sp. Ac-20340 TaxID=2703888 RepID=UPI00198165FD|nr:HNH endonuclease [Paraburkholderia sp. Ac-20340]MBN3854561.1 hypothetical protein [Paraburkholderia sp. Ac-20340]
MRDVQPGDLVFHLCGHSGNAAFAGFSTVASSCSFLDNGPNGPEKLYRVELSEFELLSSPLSLTETFAARNSELRAYFRSNRNAGAAKERIFYVEQAGRLQCLNGAYLSYVSDSLLHLLFGIEIEVGVDRSTVIADSTNTGTVLRSVAARIGQQNFARNVKQNYGFRCCFPGCGADNVRFLIGSHIARWADTSHLRGETNNGVCLCVLHDRAFEIGAFTFDCNGRIVTHPEKCNGTWLRDLLEPAVGHFMRIGKIPPSPEALAHHWAAHGFSIS